MTIVDENDARTATAGEITLIEQALHAMLKAIREHEQSYRRIRKPLRLISWEQIGKQSPVHALLNDPIGEALRLGIKELGGRLYDLGGIGLMQAVCTRVAGLDSRWRANRETIMDYTWSGIGSDGDRWWA